MIDTLKIFNLEWYSKTNYSDGNFPYSDFYRGINVGLPI